MKSRIATLLMFSFLIAGIHACGGGGGGGSTQSTPPPAAVSMAASLKTNMTKSLPMIAPVESGIIFMMNPGTLLAQGITAIPDLSAGSLPNTFTFSGLYDGNGDGIRESTLSGRTTFSTDPVSGWSGLNGTATIDVSVPVVGHLYTAGVAYSVTSADERLSGSGTFTNPLTGAVTTMLVPAGTPLIIKPATGAADAVANACGYSIDGQLKVSVTDAAGRLDTNWVFSAASPTTSVQGTTYTDGGGKVTPLPDTTTTLTCGNGGSITDWVAATTRTTVASPVNRDRRP